MLLTTDPRRHDVARGGPFLVGGYVADAEDPPLTLISNWVATLKR